MALFADIRGTKEFKHYLEVAKIFRNYWDIKKTKGYSEIFMIAFSRYFLDISRQKQFTSPISHLQNVFQITKSIQAAILQNGHYGSDLEVLEFEF